MPGGGVCVLDTVDFEVMLATVASMTHEFGLNGFTTTIEVINPLATKIDFSKADMFYARANTAPCIAWRPTLTELIEVLREKVPDPRVVSVEWMCSDGGGGKMLLKDIAVPDRTIWRPRTAVERLESRVERGTLWIVERTDTRERIAHGQSLERLMKELAVRIKGDAQRNSDWGLELYEKQMYTVYGLSPSGGSSLLETHEWLEQQELMRWKTEAEIEQMIAEQLLVQNTRGI